MLSIKAWKKSNLENNRKEATFMRNVHLNPSSFRNVQYKVACISCTDKNIRYIQGIDLRLQYSLIGQSMMSLYFFLDVFKCLSVNRKILSLFFLKQRTYQCHDRL